MQIGGYPADDSLASGKIRTFVGWNFVLARCIRVHSGSSDGSCLLPWGRFQQRDPRGFRDIRPMEPTFLLMYAPRACVHAAFLLVHSTRRRFCESASIQSRWPGSNCEINGWALRAVGFRLERATVSKATAVQDSENRSARTRTCPSCIAQEAGWFPNRKALADTSPDA